MNFSVRPFSVTTRTTLSGTPPGTLTQLPILTMPGDDIGHPIPDLTGYITEGQIVLDRELDRRGIYPPIKVLPRLSRLMDADTGEGYTHADHPALAHQLFAACARAVRVRTLASVMGEQGLPEAHRAFLALGKRFENDMLQQAGSRTLENVLLPEIDESLRYIEEQLDALDQEEALRVRNAAGGRN